MRSNLDQEDIDLIANRVAEIIKPLLNEKNGSGEPFFDVQALAEYLRVDESWVYQQVHLRNIPFYKLGKYVRFRKSELEQWTSSLKLPAKKMQDTLKKR
jgi:excisionase family DNA binding protein